MVGENNHRFRHFGSVFPKKRLELKSLKGQTNQCIVGGLRFRSIAIRFLNLYGGFNCRFWFSFSEERLELKSLKRQTNAEEEGPC